MVYNLSDAKIITFPDQVLLPFHVHLSIIFYDNLRQSHIFCKQLKKLVTLTNQIFIKNSFKKTLILELLYEEPKKVAFSNSLIGFNFYYNNINAVII